MESLERRNRESRDGARGHRAGWGIACGKVSEGGRSKEGPHTGGAQPWRMMSDGGESEERAKARRERYIRAGRCDRLGRYEKEGAVQSGSDAHSRLLLQGWWMPMRAKRLYRREGMPRIVGGLELGVERRAWGRG